VRVSGTLLGRADFRQALAQRFGKALLDFPRDQSDSIKVLNVNLIFQPEASELHADKVGDRGDEDALFRAYGSRSRNWFKVLGADFFTYENQMHAAASVRILGHQKHIHASRMAIYEAVWFNDGPNRLQLVTVNRHIYVASESCRGRINLINMQIGCKTADHSDWYTRLFEQSRESCRDVNNLVHSALEYSVGEHGLYLKF